VTARSGKKVGGGKPGGRVGGKRRESGRKPQKRLSPGWETGWPEFAGEAVLIALVISVPLVINTKSSNICDIKDVVLGLGVALGLALWLIGGLARGQLSWVSSRLNLAACAFVGWAGISLIYAHYRYVTVSEFGRLAAHLGLFFLALVSLRSLAQVRRVIAAAACSAVPICIYAFVQVSGHDPISWSLPKTRAFSFLGNPTYLGGYLALLIPVIVASIWAWRGADQPDPGGQASRPSKVVPTLFFGLVAMMLACLYYSVSLAVVIGLAFAGLLTLALLVVRGGRRALRTALLAGAVSCLLLGAAGVIGYSRLPGFQQRRVKQVLHFQDPYGKERRLHWRTAYAIFAEHPILGEGYGAFRLSSLGKMAAEWYGQSAARAEKMLTPAYVHNEYLQALSDTGIIGAVLLLVLSASALGVSVRVAVRHPAPAWAALGLGITAALTAFVLQNFVGVTFHQTGTVTFFWLWLGLIALGAASLPRPGAEPGALRLRRFDFRPLPLEGVIAVGLAEALVLALLAWLVIRPMMASVELGRSRALAQAGYFRESAQLADHAVSLCPYSAMGYYTAAYAWGKSGEFDKAIAASKKALELMPGNASMYYNLGVSYKERGQYAEAEQNFRMAVKLMPTSYLHQAAVAEALLKQERVKEAEPFARETVRLSPENPKSHLLLAEVLAKEGNLSEMAAELEQADRLDPRNPSLKEQLARLLLRLGQHGRAITVCEEWVRLEPLSAVAEGALGASYYNNRQYQEAKQHLLRALQLDPSLGVARYNLALALVRLGEDAGAVAQWQYLAAHEPNTNEGRQAQQILSRLRQVPPAQRPPGAAR